jgi:hypothetical protein
MLRYRGAILMDLENGEYKPKANTGTLPVFKSLRYYISKVYKICNIKIKVL